MSKKTAPKKTKKPTIADDLHVLKESFEAQAEFLIDWRKRLDDRLTALESRSAPAEAWVPKVGDWVVVTAKSGLFLRGHISKVCRTGPQGGVYLNQPNMADGCCVERKHLRPATPAEIADHKAKEEQRAKEAEWAKYDELQDGDACAATSEEQDKVIAMSKDAGFLKGYTSSYRDPEGLTWKPDTYPDSPLQFGIHSSNVMPFTEWERRLRGTIAKRAEEERAKELAKPLEFGTRVKWGSFTGRVACEGPDHQNEYLVAYKPGNGSVWHSTWVHRCDLTVID